MSSSRYWMKLDIFYVSSIPGGCVLKVAWRGFSSTGPYFKDGRKRGVELDEDRDVGLDVSLRPRGPWMRDVINWLSLMTSHVLGPRGHKLTSNSTSRSSSYNLTSSHAPGAASISHSVRLDCTLCLIALSRP